MPKVIFTKDNITVDVKKGAKIIDVAKENNADVLFGCIDGLCGTCMVTVEEGIENLKSNRRK